MSTRTDIVRQVTEKGFEPEVFRQIGTEDMTFYSGHLGIDVQGRDAAAEALAKVFPDGRYPSFQGQGDPIEQGNFVVQFYQATLPSGELRNLCQVYRFTDDDKVSAGWTMRG